MNIKTKNNRKMNTTVFSVLISIIIVFAALTMLVPELYGWDCMPGEDKSEKVNVPKTRDSTSFFARYLRRSFQLAEKNLFEAHFILEHAEQINLSDSQQDKIESIVIAFQESTIRISAEIKILELRFASDIRSGGSVNMDKKTMEKHIRLISKQKTDWVVTYINYLLDIRQVLQTEQLKTLKHLSEKRQKKRMKRRPQVPRKEQPPSENSAI